MSEKKYVVKKTNDELKHWGAIGMKWGLRRYQNEDGTLTPEGKIRYGKSSLSREEINKIHANEDKLEEEILSKTASVLTDTGSLFKGKGSVKNDYKTTYKKVKYSKLSDKELSERINRLSLENRYADLTGDNKYVKSGQEKARETLQTVGSVVAIAGTVVSIGAAVRKIRDGNISGGKKK